MRLKDVDKRIERKCRALRAYEKRLIDLQNRLNEKEKQLAALYIVTEFKRRLAKLETERVN